MRKYIDEASQRMLQSFAKIGILATTDESGCPHLTFINSIRALSDTRLTFGQFCAGLSKQFILERPQVGFAALNADMEYLCGNATYTHSAVTGPEFDAYNDIPLFRYNTYFGFSRVHYLDLDAVTKLGTLDMKRIIAGAVLTRLYAPFLARRRKKALNHVGKRLFAQLDGLKFLAYSDENGVIRIIPVIHASHAGSDRIVFSLLSFGGEIKRVQNGARVAVLCLNLNMESVLIKGVYTAPKPLVRCGTVEIERVYNSMPPKMEYVYPRSACIEPVFPTAESPC